MNYQLWAVLFFTALTSSCSLSADGDVWTVMSWNVQNLFDGQDDGTEYTEFDPGRGKWNQRLYERRLDRIGEVILKAVPGAADLLILQELENSRVLEDLAGGVLGRAGYRSRVIIPGYGIISTGVLSRFPVSSVSVFESGYYGIRSLRPALVFTVDLPGGSVTVIAVHWKSPWDGVKKTESARRKEAWLVRQIISRKMDEEPDVKFLIIGDLNTSGDGQISPAALAPWEPGKELRDSVLYKSEWPEGVGMQNGVLVLYDPEPSMGPPGTYWYKKAWHRPDRALMSRSLINLINGSGVVFESIRTWGGFMLTPGGYPFSWDSKSEAGYSDHLPLVLEFRFQ